MMHAVLVPAKSESGQVIIVLKNNLEALIKERRIQKFRRSSDWIESEGWLNEDERKQDNKEYKGPERRFWRTVNWALFPLSIREQLRRGQSVEAIIGYGQRAQEIALKLKSVANTNLTVLLQGETGTGKGVAASILHELSNRKEGSFVKVDCGALPPTLIESELFGFERGSFTGAFRSKPGRFQLANGGTIFLDEISNLSMDMQTRLLGFLEERVVNSIGATSPIKLDVRVISASNADLVDRVRRNEFREDLLYRLSEFQITLPPLKERSDDIFYLATKLLWIANHELKKEVFGFSEKAIDFLSSHDWSGNIRELKNLIRRAVLLTDEVIEVEDLQSNACDGTKTQSLDGCLENAFVKGRSLHEISDMIRKMAERKIIERVYEQLCKNKTRTCEALGIDYSTLYRKIKEYAMQ